MAGIFGIIDGQGTTDSALFLRRVSETISHFDWHKADTWISSDKTIGLGRSTIGIFNPEPQPLISHNGRYVLFMSGELFRTDQLKKRLDRAGMPYGQTHPELALAAFRAFGDAFAYELEGEFFIVIYDTAVRRLWMATDRLCQYPHYYTYRDGKLAFAPEVKGVLKAPFIRPVLNETAVAEYFRFQHLLEEKTFHEGIQRFPYGSIGIFDLKDGSWRLQRYWDWDQIERRYHVNRMDAVQEGAAILKDAVQIRAADNLRTGVFLSGGLDSRAIVGLLPPGKKAVTATFGQSTSRDVHYAARIARAVGSRHHWFDLPNGHWILDNLELHLKLTEGFHSWLHMHGISMLPKLRREMDYNLSGWDGGTVMFNSDPNDPVFHAQSHAEMTRRMYEGMTRTYTWPGLTDDEEKQVFNSPVGKRLIGRAFESLDHEFRRYEFFNPLWRGEFFYNVNNCFRLLQNMVTIYRSHMDARFPFWDYRLIEFQYSLPLAIRTGLYRQIISHSTPHLALIPQDVDEYLPTTNRVIYTMHKLAVKTARKLRLRPKRATLYADYERYLRHDLRHWAEMVLDDRRTEERGIINVPFAKSLMHRHVVQREPLMLGKIAPLITFELMMRRYFD